MEMANIGNRDVELLVEIQQFSEEVQMANKLLINI
jgi:hypothetical protein